jgi:hypothetical protein
VRFFWNTAGEGEGRINKILRKVIYPARLDVMEFCDPKLTKNMSNARKILINDKDKVCLI